MKNSVISSAIGALATICTLFGINLIGMPVPFLKKIICLTIGYIVAQLVKLYSLSKEYGKNRDKNLMSTASQSNNENNIQINNNNYDEQIKSIKKKIKVAIWVVIIISIFNTKYVAGFAQEFFKKVENNHVEEISTENADEEEISTENSDVEEISTENSDVEEISIENPDVEEISTENADEEETKGINDQNKLNKWTEFRLEHPECYPEIDDSEYLELYNELFYVNEDNLDETVKGDIIIWMYSCTNDTPLDNAVTSEGNSTDYYSKIELSFSNENGVLLSSDLLDEVIKGRKELNDLYPNNALAWMLANHYQTYALNYLNQSNDEKSVLYLYMKSIDSARESLQFDIRYEDKCIRIKYIQARYKDIAEYKLLDGGVCLKAYEISNAIEKELDGLINEQNEFPQMDEPDVVQ